VGKTTYQPQSIVRRRTGKQRSWRGLWRHTRSPRHTTRTRKRPWRRRKSPCCSWCTRCRPLQSSGRPRTRCNWRPRKHPLTASRCPRCSCRMRLSRCCFRKSPRRKHHTRSVPWRLGSAPPRRQCTQKRPQPSTCRQRKGKTHTPRAPSRRNSSPCHKTNKTMPRWWPCRCLCHTTCRPTLRTTSNARPRKNCSCLR